MSRQYIKKSQSLHLKSKLRAINIAGGDWRSYANTHSISNSTAYRWLRSSEDAFKKKGGKTHEKFRQEVCPFFGKGNRRLSPHYSEGAHAKVEFPIQLLNL